MADKTRPMSQSKQLIRLHKENYPIKTIAGLLSIRKNTVKTYLKKVSVLNLPHDIILEIEDPILDGMLSSGNPAYSDQLFEYLKERLSYFEKEMLKTGVNRKLLWSKYLVANPQGYQYSQFYFHLR